MKRQTILQFLMYLSILINHINVQFTLIQTLYKIFYVNRSYLLNFICSSINDISKFFIFQNHDIINNMCNALSVRLFIYLLKVYKYNKFYRKKVSHIYF